MNIHRTALPAGKIFQQGAEALTVNTGGVEPDVDFPGGRTGLLVFGRRGFGWRGFA
jgi:hypothetical protein